MKDNKIKCPGCKGRIERHIEYEKDCCFWTVALIRDLEMAFAAHWLIIYPWKICSE